MFAGPLRPGAAPQASMLSADDFNLLLAAVCERLRSSALAAPPGDRLAQTVLDCVLALQNLQHQADGRR